MADKMTFGQRVRDAGGFYRWLNTWLVSKAGPAAVGPYESAPPPTAAKRAEQACPLCGRPMSEHTFDRSGPKPLMHCP